MEKFSKKQALYLYHLISNELLILRIHKIIRRFTLNMKDLWQLQRLVFISQVKCSTHFDKIKSLYYLPHTMWVREHSNLSLPRSWKAISCTRDRKSTRLNSSHVA